MRRLNISVADMGFVPVKAFLKQMLGGIKHLKPTQGVNYQR
jgi:hypothetical protein